MFLKKSNKIPVLSDGLRYHLEKGLTLDENIFPYGSDEFCDLICEVRSLYHKGIILVDQEEMIWIEGDCGVKFIDIDTNKEYILDLPIVENIINGYIYFVVYYIEKIGKFKEYLETYYFSQSVEDIFFNNMTYFEYQRYLTEKDKEKIT